MSFFLTKLIKKLKCFFFFFFFLQGPSCRPHRHSSTPEYYYEQLDLILNQTYTNIPRVFVNIMTMFNISQGQFRRLKPFNSYPLTHTHNAFNRFSVQCWSRRHVLRCHVADVLPRRVSVHDRAVGNRARSSIDGRTLTSVQRANLSSCQQVECVERWPVCCVGAAVLEPGKDLDVERIIQTRLFSSICIHQRRICRWIMELYGIWLIWFVFCIYFICDFFFFHTVLASFEKTKKWQHSS